MCCGYVGYCAIFKAALIMVYLVEFRPSKAEEGRSYVGFFLFFFTVMGISEQMLPGDGLSGT